MKKFKMVMMVIATIFTLGLLTGCANVKPKLVQLIKAEESEYLVYVSHEDCVACQQISEQVNAFRLKSEGNNTLIKFYKVDLKYTTSSDPEKDYGIQRTPTLLYIKDGKVVKKAVGTEDVLKLFEKHYGKL